MPLSGREKATIFLSILGTDTSARVLRYLPDELADLIASGINHLPSPSPQALSEVLDEFKGFLALPNAGEVPPQLEQREVPPAPPPVPKKSYTMLVYERPQMIAFLLSLFTEQQKEEALLSLPRERAVVSELLSGLYKNPLHAKLGNKLKAQFAGKIF